MKTTILFLIIITGGWYGKASEIRKDSVILSEITEERDSLGMPDVNDVFFILTSDTASDGKEGIFREVRIGDTVYSEESSYKINVIDYELKSESRGISGFGFTYEKTETKDAPKHLRQRKSVLPKEFLKRIEPIDLGTEFSQFKNEQEIREFFLSLRLPGKAIGEIREMRVIDIVLDKSPRKPVWLIDRRYMTKDEMLLLEVSPGFILDKFGIQKNKEETE